MKISILILFLMLNILNSCSSSNNTTQAEKNEKALYQKFLAKKAYDELNKEIPK